MATKIVKVFIDSIARVLLLECYLNLLRSTEWEQVVPPALREAACRVETVEFAANIVGVPSGERKAFVVRIRSGRPERGGERLRGWRRDIERCDSGCASLGVFLGRRGTYFLKRGVEERGYFLSMIPSFPSLERTPWARNPPKERTDRAPWAQAISTKQTG